MLNYYGRLTLTIAVVTITLLMSGFSALPTALATSSGSTDIGDAFAFIEQTRAQAQRNAQVAHQVLGYSTGGLPITGYSFGTGSQRVVFIGGIHGGYEWNTVVLAYAAIDYFIKNPATVPETVTLQIIPVANPDGLNWVADAMGRFDKAPAALSTVEGRFNQNRVDLNRNWGCKWQSAAWWGVREVSGGSQPFSEIETRVLRRFLQEDEGVEAVVFWHSAGDGVFPGHCGERLPDADALALLYANAAQYPVHDSFGTYEVTGDATDWLAAQGIPALVVELTSHNDAERQQNLRAMRAVLEEMGANK